MKKKFLIFILLISICLSAIPILVNAETQYGVYAFGSEFTSNRLTITGLMGDAVYSPQTKTLTLNNFYGGEGGSNGVIMSTVDGLTVIVNGTCTLDVSRNSSASADNSPDYGMMFNGTTVIKGKNNNKSTDKLIITSKNTYSGTVDAEGYTCFGIYAGVGCDLSISNITLDIKDNSEGDYLGHFAAILNNNSVTIDSCTIKTRNAENTLYDCSKSNITIKNTVFDIESIHCGLNFYEGTDTLSNVSGTIKAKYPIFAQKALNIESCASLLTLNSTASGITVISDCVLNLKQPNLKINAKNGIQLEDTAKMTLSGGEVTISSDEAGLKSLDSTTEFSVSGGTLTLAGAKTNSVGIAPKGKVNISGGTTVIKDSYIGIQSFGEDVTISGGKTQITATGAGFASAGAGDFIVKNNADITLNATAGVQLTENMGSSFNQSGGKTVIDCTSSGIIIQSGNTAELSGGEITIKDSSKSNKLLGIYGEGKITVNGAAITFNNALYDITVYDKNSSVKSGTLNLSGSTAGLNLYCNFTVSGGDINYSGSGYGIYGKGGTYTLSGGDIDISTEGYPIITSTDYTTVIDFAGADVKLNTTQNCALAIQGTGSLYKMTNGTLLMKSISAASNMAPNSFGTDYELYAGESADKATLKTSTEMKTQATYASNKYALLKKTTYYTLSVVNTKESAGQYKANDTITYNAKDASANTHFSHWELTVGTKTETVGTNTKYTGKMPQSNATLKAVYENCYGGSASCLAKAVCVVCKKEYGDKLSHNPETVKGSAATCTDNGLTDGSVCTLCKTELVKQEVITATGHNIPDGNITKPASCIEDGEIKGYCTVCKKDDVTAVIKKSNHSPVTVKGKEATCVEYGLTDGTVCSLCKQPIEEQKNTKPKGHTLVKEEKAGTEYGKKCTVCNEKVVENTVQYSDLWTSDGNYDTELYNSAEGNWVIKDAEDLAAFAKKVNSGCRFSGYTVSVEPTVSEINLEGHNWIAIGDYTAIGKNNAEFEGTFDGHGVKITNITYSGDARFLGLFGALKKNSTIKNIIASGNIRSYNNKGNTFIGGICAYNYGTVINCSFEGWLYAESAYLEHSVGGIAGENDGKIYNCFTNCVTTAITTGDGSLNSCAGIAGTSYQGKVSNCYTVSKAYAANAKYYNRTNYITSNKYNNNIIENCYYSEDSKVYLESQNIGTKLSIAQISGALDEINDSFIELTVNGENIGKISLLKALNTYVESSDTSGIRVWQKASLKPIWQNEIAVKFNNEYVNDITVYSNNGAAINDIISLDNEYFTLATPYLYVYKNGSYQKQTLSDNIVNSDLILTYDLTVKEEHPHISSGCKIKADGNHYFTCNICKKDIDSEYTDIVTKYTCTTYGYTAHTCNECGVSFIDNIVPASHNYDDGVITEPECESMGYTTYTCSVCKDSYKKNYINPIGHDFDNGVVTSAPTLFSTGILTQTCSHCKTKKQTEIPVLTECDGKEGCPSKLYDDVPSESHWAHKGIDFVLKSGLFYGTDERTFSPNGTMTRAMIVCVLYRLAGSPDVEYTNTFKDVPEGKWYSKGVIWANENEIVTGTGGGYFNPDKAVTREQIALILYKYTLKFINDTPKTTSLDSFKDASKVSYWAKTAMEWAVADGIIAGSGVVDIYLNPQKTATRAEVATMLMKFVSDTNKNEK